MTSRALGLIETIGLTTAIEAADAAVKSANVTLLGYENARGGGLITVKVVGDVGAVKAAVSAGAAAALRVGKVQSCLVIPRPHEAIEALIGQADRGRAAPSPVSEKPKPAVAKPEKPKPVVAKPEKRQMPEPAERPAAPKVSGSSEAGTIKTAAPKGAKSLAKAVKPAPQSKPEPVAPPAPLALSRQQPVVPDQPEEPPAIS
jgi:ethanolamine utilization protein EutM